MTSKRLSGHQRLVGLVLVLALMPLPMAAIQKPAFEAIESPVGTARHQTLLTGQLLDDAGVELAIISSLGSEGRTLSLYSLEQDGWHPRFETTLSDEVRLVEVARIGRRDHVATYERDRVRMLDPVANEFRTLIDMPTRLRVTGGDVVPATDMFRDLNRDGLDDLVVPDVAGFWLSIQQRDGTFSEPQLVGAPEPFAEIPVGNLDVGESATTEPRNYGEVGITEKTIPAYLGRLHEVDFDLDGRMDLVFWDEDRFEVHPQQQSGLFDSQALEVTTEVAIDSDGVYSRAFDFRDQGVVAAILGLGEKSERTVLHSLVDINADGLADLITLNLAGRSITRQQSRYEIHFGIRTPGGIVFASDADVVIRPAGRAGAMQPWGYAVQRFEDFDGDGQRDILFQDVRVGFGGMMRAMAGRSVPIDLEVYDLTDAHRPAKPATRHKIRRFAPLGGSGVFFPVVLTGDINGDGRADVVVGTRPKELQVFLGVARPDLISPEPQSVSVTLPCDERRTRLVDLDADGKLDVLIHRAPTDSDGDEPFRITTLLAR
jgi:hypothetical protein